MKQFVVFAELDNDRRDFIGVFDDEVLRDICIEETNKAYGHKLCYWEETELNKRHN